MEYFVSGDSYLEFSFEYIFHSFIIDIVKVCL